MCCLLVFPPGCEPHRQNGDEFRADGAEVRPGEGLCLASKQTCKGKGLGHRARFKFTARFWCARLTTQVDHWLASGKLTWKPDRLTGSTDPAMREYVVPSAWSRSTDENSDGVVLNSSTDSFQQKDIDNVEALRPTGACSSSSCQEQPQQGKDINGL